VTVEAAAPATGEIVRWLEPLIGPDSVIELRALNCVDNPKYGSFTIAGWFDADHLDDLAAAALVWTPKAEGVYVTMNPVNRDLMARAFNRVVKIKKDLATKDGDIVRRAQLVFDADPERPAGISATDAEKTLALSQINQLVENLSARGWPEPVLADSGNGYHAKYRIDLANNDGSLELVKKVLATANQLFGLNRVKIDISLSNASRIIKLPGTMARKGDDITERPHRWSSVVSAPDELLAVPTDRLEVFAALFDPEPTDSSNGSPFIQTATNGASPENRARAYVFAPGFPDSISGQNGHGPLFYAASVLVDGFGLSRQTAMPILRDWNQQKAIPPEDEKQINHKLDDAIKKHPAPSLKLLNTNHGNHHANGIKPNNAKTTAKLDLSWVPCDFATLADAAKELEDTAYAWDLWIPRGSLTAVVAPPGVGKTRLIAEWSKRLWFKEAMPDGIATPFPEFTKTLWLCYDRNWRGLVRSFTQFSVPLEAVLLPTRRGKPLWLPDFDKPETMDILREFIKVHKPGWVVIDTTTYASAFNTGKPNEAKIAYDPIMDVLMDTHCAGLGLTHTNNEGGVLNKRYLERCRVRVDVTRPDPNSKERLRVEVTKSDDKTPPPLGAVFNDTGIAYDTKPPETPDAPRRGPKATAAPGLAEFLWEYLQTGPAPIVDIVNAARDKGLLKSPTTQEPKPSISPLYAARDWVARQHPGKTVDQFEQVSPKGKKLQTWQIIDAAIPREPGSDDETPF
jgi:AAA domain